MTNQSSASNNEASSSPSSLSDGNSSSGELSPTGSVKQPVSVSVSVSVTDSECVMNGNAANGNVNETSPLSPTLSDHQLDNSCSSNNTSRDESSNGPRRLKRSRVSSQSDESSPPPPQPPAKVSKIGYSIMNILGPAKKPAETTTTANAGKHSNKENSVGDSTSTPAATPNVDVQQSPLGLLNPLNISQQQQQQQFLLNPFLAAAAAAAAQGANNNHLLNNISNLALLSGLPGGGKPANPTGEFWPWLNMASAMSAFYGLDSKFILSKYLNNHHLPV